MNNILIEEKNNIVKIKNNYVCVEYHLDKGYFSILQDKNKIIEKAHSEVRFAENKYCSINESKKEYSVFNGGDYKTLIIEDKQQIEYYLKFTLHKDNPEITIDFNIKNKGDNVEIEEIIPLYIDKLNIFNKIDKCYFYKQGYQSWSPTLSLKTTQRDIVPKEIIPGVSILKTTYESHPFLKREKKRGIFYSDGITVISDDNNFLLLGFTSCKNYLTQIRFFIDDFKENKFRIYTVCSLDNYVIEKEKEIFSETLIINFTGEKLQALNNFCNITTKNMSARKIKKVPVGWCSWYYYFNKITQDDILRNLEVVSQIKNILPFEYFQIDDGYQQDIGDWTKTNNKFPSGMKYIADKIKEAGFVPGLWIAPFVVRPTSTIYKQHPDWILKDTKGKPVLAGINPLWGGRYFALDLTHPEVLEHLKNIFSIIVNDFGYKFLKLDFIFAGALCGVYYQKNITRVQAYRMGLKAIRDSAGDDTFILGCGAPIFPSIGLVDGMRISSDVDPSWIHWSEVFIGREFTLGAYNSIRNTITRYFMHNNFWVNDPDCLLVRSDRNKLNIDEIKTLVSVIALSGGMVLSSDNFQTLSDDRIKFLQYCTPPTSGVKKVIDILNNSYPKYLLVDFEKQNRKWKVLCVINWKDKKSDIEINTSILDLETDKKYCLYNFWKKEFSNIEDNIIKFSDVPAHGCELVKIMQREDDIPQIVATDFHISQGEEIDEYYFNRDLSQLYFKIKIPYKSTGDIVILIPEHLKYENFTTTANEFCSKFENNLLTINAAIDKEATFTLNFKKN